jgi:hypothetical protein
MSDYNKLIIPFLLAVLGAIVQAFKNGAKTFTQYMIESIAAILTAYLGFFVMTVYFKLDYNIACGFCGYLGYLSPKMLKGFEDLLNAAFIYLKAKHFNTEVKKTEENANDQ